MDCISNDDLGELKDIDTWDDSTSTIKGFIKVSDQANPTIWVGFNVTGAVTSKSGYSTIVVAHVAGQGSLSNGNAVAVSFFSIRRYPELVGRGCSCCRVRHPRTR